MSVIRRQKRPLIESFLPIAWDFLYAMDKVDLSANTVYDSGLLARPATIATGAAAKQGVYNGANYLTFDADATNPVWLSIAHAAWMEQQHGQGFTLMMLARLGNATTRQAGMYKNASIDAGDDPTLGKSWSWDLSGASPGTTRFDVSGDGFSNVGISVANSTAWTLYLARFTPGAEVAIWGAGGIKQTNTTNVPSTLNVNVYGIAIGRINTSNSFMLGADVALAGRTPWMDDATINGLIYAARDNGMG